MQIKYSGACDLKIYGGGGLKVLYEFYESLVFDSEKDA